MSAVVSDWTEGLNFDTARLRRVGIGLTLVFAGGFGAWAALAPIAGATVAAGVVTAAGQNQRIQHPDGGVVTRLLVRDGDRVTRGQILFALDATAAEANRNRLQNLKVALFAQADRLAAERDGLDAVSYTAVPGDDAPDVAAVRAEQTKEFATRLERHRQEGSILAQRVNALNEQVAGLKAQRAAMEEQLRVVEDETARKKKLLFDGLTDRSQYTNLLRSRADLTGQLAQMSANILASGVQITEAGEQQARLATQRMETAAAQLNELRTRISSLEEELKAASAQFERREVHAPTDGIVVRRAVNAEGSVVRPGETVLDILPTGQDPVVEARITPRDVNHVSVGGAATLRFSSLNARTTPVADAIVTYVSADRLADERSGQPYYLVRLALAKEQTKGFDTGRIQPGMPAEVFVTGGSRTFAEYLTQPILDSLNRTFREQ